MRAFSFWRSGQAGRGRAPRALRTGAFWLDGPDGQLAAAKSRKSGLTAREARSRLRRDGPNHVSPGTRRNVVGKLARRFAEPLVAILLIAASVSGWSGDIAGFAIILTIVAISVGLDVVQEHRAEQAVDALRRSIAVTTSVWRDGKLVRMPVENVVVGDVLALRQGDFVPADGVVLESREASANEALLTGEPYPVGKRPGPSDAADPTGAYDALFAGTSLVAGEATMLVVATGPATRFGGIAAALEANEPPTAFERGLHDLGVLIVRLTAFLVLFVLLAHLAFQRPPLESFLFAVALAVGLTPELLPMVTTVTLSRGALRMAARRVIVKRLAAIHDLGSMDVLCTDKTGTLTEARITLADSLDPDARPDARVLELAALNSRFAGGVRSALDDAIEAGSAALDLSGWRRLAAAPFDFERRRASVLVEGNGRRLVIVKGAPEAVIAACAHVERDDGGIGHLDGAARARLAAIQEARASDGLRLLAVAWREAGVSPDALAPADETDLVFAGFCAFVDPPKVSAGAAVARLRAQGVRVKIISGDAAPVVRHLVGALALNARSLLTGVEIAAMTDAALAQAVSDTDLFARVSPEQKMRIIRALQSRGHVVGFVGDGVNDAPAIKAADCGLSVEGASDVARAAADLILLAPDLGVLADGVEEGRRTYANITKYVRMGTSSNFGNMMSMALASLAIPFLPLTAVQILLNNLLYDLSEIGIPFDHVDAADVAAPHGWDMRDVLRFTVVMGPLSSLFDLATFAILRGIFEAGPELFRTAWFVESLSTQILVIFLIRTAGAPWSSRPHPVLVATSLGALAVGLFAALGPFAALIGFAPLPGPLLMTIGVLVASYLSCAQGAKRWAVER